MAKEDDNEAGEEKKKSPLMMIIIIAVACLGLGGGGAFFLLGSSGGDAEAMADTEKPAKEEMSVKESFYFSLDPAFVVNFQGKSRARFLQVNIDGMTREEVIKQEVTKHLPQIRNNIVLLLSSKTYDDLITPEGKEIVRQEILSEIQKVMMTEVGKEGVENIFFTSFVIQ